MKYMLRVLVAGLLVAAVTNCPGADVRIATVDLRKIFDSYWKKKQAETILKERSDGFAKEVNDRQTEIKKENEDYQALQTNVNDPNISPDERDKRKKASAEKLKHLRELDEELKQFERQAQ